MGQPTLAPRPSIYGQGCVALQPEGFAWVSDEQDYDEYSADTGDGFVLDAPLQERLRPLGVLTPDGGFICRWEDPQEHQAEDPQASYPAFPLAQAAQQYPAPTVPADPVYPGPRTQEPAPTPPPPTQRDGAVAFITVSADLFQQVVMWLGPQGCLGLLLTSHYTRGRLGWMGIRVWLFLGQVRLMIPPYQGAPDPENCAAGNAKSGSRTVTKRRTGGWTAQ